MASKTSTVSDPHCSPSISMIPGSAGMPTFVPSVEHKGIQCFLWVGSWDCQLVILSSSWQIDGEKMESGRFYFLGSQITADGDCSHEIKRRLLLGRKVMTNLDGPFANKGPYSQSYGFPVVRYGCENWTIKKAECWKIDAFKLWCRRRLLRVPWTARRSNQSILKEINPEYSLEGLMLKLKLQYFGHLMQRTDTLEKTLMLGEDWGQEEKGMTEDEMIRWHHWLNGNEFEQTPGR